MEAIELPNSKAKSVTTFLRRHIFFKFGTPRAIISDGISGLCNRMFSTLLEKHGVKYKVEIPYLPQSSG